MKWLFTVLCVVVLTLVAPTAHSAQSSQSDQRIGTWKPNVAKSKRTTLTDEIRTYIQSGSTVSAHLESLRNDGSKEDLTFDATADGKDHRYTGQGAAGAETVSIRRVGNTFTDQSKKGRELLYTTRGTFSDDGKTMTLISKGIDANGKPFSSVRVYDRQ